MRELPEPEGQLAWQTFTRDQVLAIQKQAYEDGLRDAALVCITKAAVRTSQGFPREASTARALSEEIEAVLTASQKEQK